jgi:hypothetical protein
MVQWVKQGIDTNTDEGYDEYSNWTDELAVHMGLTTSIWSIFEVMDFNAVPYPDSLVLEYHGGWGTPQRFVFERPPTYADLWEAADMAIRLSGDGHHVFIEDFVLDNGVIKLRTGS